VGGFWIATGSRDGIRNRTIGFFATSPQQHEYE